MHKGIAAAIITAAGLTCSAQAQLAQALTNGGFELRWEDGGHPVNARSGGVLGFTNNNDAPAAVNTTFFHGGARSIEIGPVPPTEFYGYTTDTVDSLPPNYTFLYYDVPISWQMGDIEWSWWYMIPAAQSLGDPPTPNWPVDANPGEDFVWPSGFAPATMKIEIKGAGNGFQNNAGYDGWSMGFARDPRARVALQWGHTNGQWRQVSIRWAERTPDRKGWKDQVEDSAEGNYSLPPAGTWPNPSPPDARWPDRAKITFGRWNPSLTGATGTIYYDDWTFVQHESGPQPCGPADIGSTGGVPGPDGVLDNNDFVVFIDYFFGQNVIADMGSTGGLPGADGAFDNNDFVVFIDYFFGGCG